MNKPEPLSDEQIDELKWAQTPSSHHVERDLKLSRAIESARDAQWEEMLSKQEPCAWMYLQSCLNDDGTQTAPWVQRITSYKPADSVINKYVTPLYAAPANQQAEIERLKQIGINGLTVAETDATASVMGLVKQEPDTARLNFIEANPTKSLRFHKKRWAFVGFTNYEYETFSTLREAIDAARAALGEQK